MYALTNEIRDEVLDSCWRLNVLEYTQIIKITEDESLISNDIKLLVEESPERLTMGEFKRLKNVIELNIYKPLIMIKYKNSEGKSEIFKMGRDTTPIDSYIPEYRYEIDIITKVTRRGESQTKVNIKDIRPNKEQELLADKRIEETLKKIEKCYNITINNTPKVEQNIEMLIEMINEFKDPEYTCEFDIIEEFGAFIDKNLYLRVNPNKEELVMVLEGYRIDQRVHNPDKFKDLEINSSYILVDRLNELDHSTQYGRKKVILKNDSNVDVKEILSSYLKDCLDFEGLDNFVLKLSTDRVESYESSFTKLYLLDQNKEVVASFNKDAVTDIDNLIISINYILDKTDATKFKKLDIEEDNDKLFIKW